MHRTNTAPWGLLCLAGVLAACGACSGSGEKNEVEMADTIDAIVAGMTLEEKAMLVVGTGMPIPPSMAGAFPEGQNPFAPGPDDAVDPSYAAMIDAVRKRVPGAAGRTAEIPRLGIPPAVLADGPAGLRIDPEREGDPGTYYATAFPIATLLASSWDVDLLGEVGRAMGDEALEYGVDIILGPGMNLHRNPLCGRNFEYYSEDPLITGKMAAAAVRGIQSRGVGACIKHFAANNQETNRMSVDTIVSRRALREIYLEGFRIAVEEGRPWVVMSSYNKINGRYTSESRDLLTGVLRQDWGFDGCVVTDWGGGSDAAAQMTAGNDLIMPGRPSQSEEILEAVRRGALQEETLDRNVRRILSVVLQTPGARGRNPSGQPDLQAHAALCRRAGAEGMVLLKNDNAALPLGAGIGTIAVFGNASYRTITGGTGSGDVHEAYSVPLVDGLRGGGYRVDPSLEARYAEYLARAEAARPAKVDFFRPAPAVAEMEVRAETAAQAAAESDAAILTIGRNSGEGGDRKAGAGDFCLTDAEMSLIRTVAGTFREKGKPAVVLLNTGGVVETASWRRYPDAILLAYQPGQEAGNAIADVLSGRVNPSGRLVDTFPMAYGDVPSADGFPGGQPGPPPGGAPPGTPGSMQGMPAEAIYGEDIWVGYRYYATFDVPVAYPFGFGLSYTRFRYDRAAVDASRLPDPFTVTVGVRNTGPVAGREVVQAYLRAPDGALEKPAIALIAFGKTRLLEPGESQQMRFVLSARDLASFDEARSGWVAEPGRYTIQIGASSEDIRQSVSFELPEGILLESVGDVLAPARPIRRLSRPAAGRP